MPDAIAPTSNWPYIYATLWSALLLINSIGTFTPVVYSMTEQAGFAQPPNQPLNVYVYLFAGCQFQVGLASAVLEYVGEWKAVSVIIACSIPMGCLSTTICALGMGEGMWTHGILTGIAAVAGWKLLKQNW
jgi:hypothetical protein